MAVAILNKLGCRADVAANGQEAIAALRAISYDLVLMDCQMPEMNGFDATRCIRSKQSGVRNSRVPVIALTARAMAGDRENCFAAGMDDYVAKPVEYAALAQVLVRWLPWEDEDSSHRAMEESVQPATVHRSF